MKAMILTAGLGTRLRPLTLERAKPAIPLLGRPLVTSLMEGLAQFGVDRFRLNLHHLPRTIESIFEHPNQRRLRVSFSHEPEILGTAGGLKANESFLAGGSFVLANGDIVMDFPLNEALRFHKERGALATMLLYPQSRPYRYYPMRIHSDGRLCNFKSRNADGEPTDQAYVFTGVHILEPEIFDYIPAGCFYEINDRAYPRLTMEERSSGSRSRVIGTISAIRRAIWVW
ncbi:NDP-sugar synthase [Thermodesulfobacteriota bacterium]